MSSLRNLIAAAVVLVSGVASALPEAVQQKAWRPVNKGTAQKAVAAKPCIMNEKLVVCGNKKLLLSHVWKDVPC